MKIVSQELFFRLSVHRPLGSDLRFLSACAVNLDPLKLFREYHFLLSCNNFFIRVGSGLDLWNGICCRLFAILLLGESKMAETKYERDGCDDRLHLLFHDNE